MSGQIPAAGELPRQRPPKEGHRPVDWNTWLLLLLSIALATTGQLLLKAGMTDVGVIDAVSFGSLGELIRGVVGSWKAIVGLASFGLSAMFWLIVLSRIPLSTAYPVVSLSYVLILGFSTLVLGERPRLTVWVGALMIMGGISLIGIGQRGS